MHSATLLLKSDQAPNRAGVRLGCVRHYTQVLADVPLTGWGEMLDSSDGAHHGAEVAASFYPVVAQ